MSYQNILISRFVLILIGLCSWQASAAIKVVAINQGLEPITSKTALVRYIPLGGFDELPLAVSTDESPFTLNFGDEIRTARSDIIVELECDDNATFSLESPFRVVLVPLSEEQGCAVSLQTGAVFVHTETPTEVTSGEVTLGSESTQYALKVWRSGGKVKKEAMVYEGKINFRQADGKRRPLKALEKINFKTTNPIKMVRADFVNGAKVYAKLDAGRSATDQRQRKKNFVAFTKLYTTVLAKPNKPEPKARLAVFRLNKGIKSPSTVRYLNKAIKQSNNNIKVANYTLLKSIAYRQTGKNDAAQLAIDQAKRVNPKINSIQLQNTYKIIPKLIKPITFQMIKPLPPSNLGFVNEAVTNPALKIRAAASPSKVPVGSRTRIRVKVGDKNGPVAGASILVSAGGGKFIASGKTKLKGKTDGKGYFEGLWYCKPCAGGYQLSVEASKHGYKSTKSSLSVKIQH